MNRSLFAFIASICVTFSFSAFSDTNSYVVAGGAFPPFQYPSAKESVYGFRISPGWARNANMYGLDMGLIGNMTDTNFVGAAVAGGFNSTSGNATIILLQAAGVANTNFGTSKIIGLQFALGYNYNVGKAVVVGVQASLVGNFASLSTIDGIQCGFINRADRVNGLQLGIINHTKNLTGLQVGLLNFADAGWISFFPILNFSI